MKHSRSLVNIFIKFALVGGSGVIVNLGTLAVLRQFSFSDSLASALAIEVSIASNFLLNEKWTFRDQVVAVKELQYSSLQRALRFQFVSLFGALLQWSTFLVFNLLWVYIAVSQDPNADLWVHYGPLFNQRGWQLLITTPPRVGDWVYASQLIGIIFATGWNFFANLYWTWGSQKDT